MIIPLYKSLKSRGSEVARSILFLIVVSCVEGKSDLHIRISKSVSHKTNDLIISDIHDHFIQP